MTGTVPVYLADRTVVGKATVSDDGHTILIHIPGSEPVAELMEENLVGMSIIYMANQARDTMAEAQEKMKLEKKPDDRFPHF